MDWYLLDSGKFEFKLIFLPLLSHPPRDMGVSTAEKLLAWKNCTLKQWMQNFQNLLCLRRAKSTINKHLWILPPTRVRCHTLPNTFIRHNTRSSGCSAENLFQPNTSHNKTEDNWNSYVYMYKYISSAQASHYKQGANIEELHKVTKKSTPLDLISMAAPSLICFKATGLSQTLLVFQSNFLGPGRHFYLKNFLTDQAQSRLVPALSASCAITPFLHYIE